jgi:hypothetical protein
MTSVCTLSFDPNSMPIYDPDVLLAMINAWYSSLGFIVTFIGSVTNVALEFCRESLVPKTTVKEKYNNIIDRVQH